MPCCQVQRTSLSEGQGSTLRGSTPSRCPDRILLIEKGLKVQVARNYQYIDNRSFMSTITFLGFPRLRACANRLASFRTWFFFTRSTRLFAAFWNIRYSPIGAASKSHRPFM